MNHCRKTTLLIMMAVLCWGVNARADDAPTVSFLDIGQGDATILHDPGQCTVLVDAGPPINGHRITEKLQGLGISNLDMVIITHPHLDHYGGLFDIAPRIHINRFFDNGVTDTAPVFTDNYLPLRKTVPHDTLHAGDTLECGQFHILVLHPSQTGQHGRDYNAESLVLMVTTDQYKLLIMGDLNGNAEQELVKETRDLKADILRIGHHGADDATTDHLLDAVQPGCAIISTGTDNRIRSPSPTVINRLENKGIKWFRTDRDGTIVLSHKGQCSSR